MSTQVENVNWVDPSYEDVTMERPTVLPGNYFVEVMENTTASGLSRKDGKPWAREDIRAKILKAGTAANEKAVGLHVFGGLFRGGSAFKRFCTHAGMANWPAPGALVGATSWVTVRDVPGQGERASETFTKITDSPEPDKVLA
jgi:hypothetical protein